MPVNSSEHLDFFYPKWLTPLTLLSSVSDVLSHTCHTQMQISAPAFWLLNGDVHASAETPFFGGFPHLDSNFRRRCHQGDLHHLSSVSGEASWAHVGGRKTWRFPHVGLCYFFHPQSQEAAQISGKQPLSVFSEAERVVPCILKKANAALFNLIITWRTIAKESSLLCLKNKPGRHSKRFHFSLPEDTEKSCRKRALHQGVHPPADTLEY